MNKISKNITNLNNIKLENINDEIILNLLIKSNKRIDGRKLKYCKEQNNDIYKYIVNRYNDSSCENETIKRILYKIDKHPICPICGKPVLFCGKANRMFLQTCSLQCGYILRTQEIKNTCIKKYGCTNVFQLDEIKEKSKQTLFKNYGVYNSQQSEIIKLKSQQTCIKKYGVKNGGGSKQALLKAKNTFLEKYGVEYPWQSEKIKEKIKNTCIKKYGATHPAKSDIVKEKIQNTCIKKYGAKSYFQSNEYKNNFEFYEYKSMLTKKKNHTWTYSKAENICYNKLIKVFNKVICQYKTKEYPFNCDFYIPEIDTYIEYQGYYTHGKHPFNPNDKNDINELNNLIKLSENHKNKDFNLYLSKINTWTKLDVLKRNTAKKNNLNYIEFFTILDLEKFLEKYENNRK